MKEDIIIFGASTRGVYVFNKLKDIYNIIAFADNDCKKWGKEIQGIKIINPKKLNYYGKKIFIASEYNEEIKAQLKEMNINNFQMYNSSIEVVLNNLIDKGIELKKISALQTFGGSGKGMERFYKDKVKELDVWEIEKSFEDDLKRNLPNANIKITDSFKEIRKTKKKYDMILIDNPMTIFGEHCEHFDMYIEAFRIMKEESIIILDIMPNLKNIDKKFEYIKESSHLLSRKLFYRCYDPLSINIEIMLQTYKEIANSNGYEIEWYFTEERSGDFIQYLVLKLKRS
ncbi:MULTISPECIES: hypothetical protein [unclassified Clostridium]|uniref:nucleoside-diphosphate sugar epimerase/dehydratase n=1 Tax=unclassified Clostridium TaxID=2614128 RepID=UPI0013F94FCC|nr:MULTISPECIES: hypothetical protein [unclassified Clostridium]NFR87446.1 hypothetical protein [Clostridium botulinum]NFR89386.1 hypothetical protein [Clostridium botulinum]NFT98975.1 hypothetical protein [Clostridium botulinum]